MCHLLRLFSSFSRGRENVMSLGRTQFLRQPNVQNTTKRNCGTFPSLEVGSKTLRESSLGFDLGSAHQNLLSGTCWSQLLFQQILFKAKCIQFSTDSYIKDSATDTPIGWLAAISTQGARNSHNTIKITIVSEHLTLSPGRRAMNHHRRTQSWGCHQGQKGDVGCVSCSVVNCPTLNRAKGQH